MIARGAAKKTRSQTAWGAAQRAPTLLFITRPLAAPLEDGVAAPLVWRKAGHIAPVYTHDAEVGLLEARNHPQ